MNRCASLLLAALLALRLAPATAGEEEPLRFKPSDHPTACPPGEHPKNGCLVVTGKNLEVESAWKKVDDAQRTNDALKGIEGKRLMYRTAN
jgi:hypothetical protein